MNQDQWGVGDKADAKAFDKTRLNNQEIELIFGEHPHSRQDKNIYARTPNGNIYDFDGHRRLIDIEIKSKNYLKESGLSGDQIRKEVMGYIYADGVKVYEVFGREVSDTLLRLHRLLIKLSEHSSRWLDADSRAELIGRKIYYHDQSATITGLIESQGCVMVTTEPGWKPPEYSFNDNGLGEKYRESWYEDYKEGDHYEIKSEVLSENIYWFRH